MVFQASLTMNFEEVSSKFRDLLDLHIRHLVEIRESIETYNQDKQLLRSLIRLSLEDDRSSRHPRLQDKR